MMQLNKKSLLVDLLFFLMGCLLTFAYVSGMYKDKVKASNNLTLDIIDNCMAAFNVQDELISNRNQAYEEIAACLLGENCNPKQTAIRLNDLNHEKDEIELELKDLIKDMDFIIGKKSSTL